MVARFSDLSVYKEIFKARDYIKALIGALLIPVALLAGKFLQIEHILLFSNIMLIGSIALNGLPIIVDAIKGLIKKKVNVDELVSIAIIACLATGNYTEGAVVCAIMVFGALIEESVSDSARREIEKLIELSPKEAIVERDGQEQKIQIENIEIGEITVVRAGDIIPLDGEVVSGSSFTDESSITGESIPVYKKTGDIVSAGTVVQDGFFRIRVSSTSENSTISQVVRLVQNAENGNIESSRIVDDYAKWFTPVILSLAALTWAMTGDVIRATTVLIVGCPCSFLLTGPVTTVAAVARAARAGILVKGGEYLEKAAVATAVFFDKTGTLTTGKPRVISMEVLNGMSNPDILGYIAAVERGSTHPLARSIVDYAVENQANYYEAHDVKTIAGTGMSGTVEGHSLYIGSLCSNVSSYTNIEIMIDSETAATISLQDLPREGVDKTLSQLKKMGMRNLTIISGDQENAVRSCAEAVGATEYFSGLKPVDKLNKIKASQERIIYTGDGINDAPALKASSVGVAMGFRGSDIALETADIVLLNDRIDRLPFLVNLSRRMTFLIKINIGISFLINLLSVILAAAGVLSPMMGAVTHNIGSILVVLLSSSLTLLKE